MASSAAETIQRSPPASRLTSSSMLSRVVVRRPGGSSTATESLLRRRSHAPAPARRTRQGDTGDRRADADHRGTQTATACTTRPRETDCGAAKAGSPSPRLHARRQYEAITDLRLRGPAMSPARADPRDALSMPCLAARRAAGSPRRCDRPLDRSCSTFVIVARSRGLRFSGFAAAAHGRCDASRFCFCCRYLAERHFALQVVCLTLRLAAHCRQDTASHDCSATFV